MTRRKKPQLIHIGLAILLILVGIMSLFGAWNDSQTIDEAAHISAGYSYLQTRDFRLNPEHPPLMKLLAGAAISPLHLKPVKNLDGWTDANQWHAGQDLVYHSPTNYKLIIFIARLPFIAIYLLLIIAVYGFTKRLFAPKIALIASSLLAVDPTVFSNGHLVTNDLLLTLAIVVFVWVSYNYYHSASRQNFWLLLLATLFVLSAKYNGIIVLPAAMLLIWRGQKTHKKTAAKHIAALLLVIGGGIWLQYLGSASSINKELSGASTIYSSTSSHPEFTSTSNRVTKLEQRLPLIKPFFAIPVPALPYFKGLANVLIHSQNGRGAYLFGNYSKEGWPYYMLVAFGIKFPTQSFVLLGIGLYALWPIRRRLKQPRTFFIAGPILYFLTISVLSSLDIGVRHILEIWPFVYVVIAVGVCRLTVSRTAILWLAALCLGSLSLTQAPLAYKNLAGAIISNQLGKPVIIDSSLDWGQDIYRLNDYLKANHIDYVGSALFTNADLDKVLQAKICELDTTVAACVKSSVTPAYYAVSDTARYQQPASYQWLANKKLITRIGGSISIYK